MTIKILITGSAPKFKAQAVQSGVVGPDLIKGVAFGSVEKAQRHVETYLWKKHKGRVELEWEIQP